MKQRAKLYCLSDEGNWNDIGTGWVSVENDTIVYMFDEESNQSDAYFMSKLTKDQDCYQLEGGFNFCHVIYIF
jgi:hypothetical protein